MYNKSKILAIIPARAGSKGIKNKNIIDLCGKPLLAYSIEAAKKSKYIDEVLVSTDGEQIAKIAKDYGAYVPFLRPKELASDTAKTIDGILHAVNYLQNNNEIYDVLVLLQPTQPLRTAKEVDAAIELFFDKNEQALASISEVEDHPLLVRTVLEDGTMKNLLDENSTCRRQDMPKFYRINGAIYINSIKELNEKTSFNDNPIPYIMDKKHAVDIDEEKDLLIANAYITAKQKD